MPFVSKAQLRTCYGKKYDDESSSRSTSSRSTSSRSSTPKKTKKKWDCDEWLKETDSVCALPEKKGLPVKKRNAKVGERIVGKLQKGPRGGKFFLITEKNKRGKEICVVKVYV